jgi:hypothetical protein
MSWEFLNEPVLSVRTMTLGSTQILNEITTRNLPGGKGLPARKADLTAICEPTVQKLRDLRRLTPLWASTACYRDISTFMFYSSAPA